MTWLWHILTVPLCFGLVVLAGAQFGAPGLSTEMGQLICLLVPLLVMVLVCMRVPSALPSIAVFLFGVVLDLSSQEPFGYWPLILLIGTALAKLHPEGTREHLFLRLGWLVVVSGGLLCSFVIIESLYFLRPPAIGLFLSAMAVFLITGWVIELVLALGRMIRLQAPEGSRLVRGDS